MFRCLLALLLIVSIADTAIAQQSASTATRTPPAHTAFDWPASDSDPYFDHNLDVVLVSQPSVRKSCHVRTITADTIVCRSRLHRKQTVYQRNEIIALIDPPYHGNREEVFVTVGLAAIALAGSFFVPLAASITLRIITGIMLDGLAWDDGIGRDHNNDLLIYQRRDASLNVLLHA